MRTLELFLLYPLPASAARARFPALQRLLARARIAGISREPVEAAMLEKFGVERQRDWPVAPFARLGDGQDPGEGYWLCADPIHLHVDRDALLLIDSSQFDLELAHAQAFVQTLNQHFGGAGLHFSAPHPKRWYVNLAQAPEIETVPLREAAGRNVEALLPRGAGALGWHRTCNEIQMLLHSHPLNDAREAQGEPTVNSVWFWGGGMIPDRVNSKWVQVWARDPLSRGLSQAAGIQVDAVPRDFAQWLDRAQDGTHLAVLDEAEFERIEAAWIAPALQALRGRVLSELRLSVATGSEVSRLELTRADLWKFWRNSARLIA